MTTRRSLPFVLPEHKNKWQYIMQTYSDAASELRVRWASDAAVRIPRDEAIRELHSVHAMCVERWRIRMQIIATAQDGVEFYLRLFDTFVQSANVDFAREDIITPSEALRVALTTTDASSINRLINGVESRNSHGIQEALVEFMAAHGNHANFNEWCNLISACYICFSREPAFVHAQLTTGVSFVDAKRAIERQMVSIVAERRAGTGTNMRGRNSLGSVRRRRLENVDDFVRQYEAGQFDAIGVDMKRPVTASEANKDVRAKCPMADARTYVSQLIPEGVTLSRDLIIAERTSDADAKRVATERIAALCTSVDDSRIKAEILDEWRKRHGPTINTYVCASCLVRDPANAYKRRSLLELRGSDFEFSDADYGALEVMRTFRIDLGRYGFLTFADLASYTMCTNEDGSERGWWLHPKFVKNSGAVICGRCWEARKTSEKSKAMRGPPGSLARGIDYGTWTPSMCENIRDICDEELELNKLESLIVSRTRRVALSATISCGRTNDDHTIFNGHVVTFPQHTDVAKNVADDASVENTVLQTVQNISVTLTGPPTSRRVVKSRLLANELVAFSVRPKRVAIWLALTKGLRDRSMLTKQLTHIANQGTEWPARVAYFRQRYMDNFLQSSMNVALMEQFDAYMMSDVSEEDLEALIASEEFKVAYAAGIIECDPRDDADVGEDVAGIREAGESGAVTESVIFDTPIADGDLLQRLASTRAGREDEGAHAHNGAVADVPRDDTPLTEYGAEQSIMLEMSWPHLFILPNSASGVRASNRRTTAKTVMYFDNRFDGVPDLYHTLFDMHVRHDMQRNAKLAVTEDDVAAFIDLERTITDLELKQWQHMQTEIGIIPPKAQELVRMIRITRPVTVPFTSAHRRRSAKHIRDMARACGGLCLFWTFNPDDKTGNTFLRLTLGKVNCNDDFPVVDDDRVMEDHLKHSDLFTDPTNEFTHDFLIHVNTKHDLLKNAAKHPVRVATEMERLVKSFVEIVLGVKTTPNTWVPKSECDPGIYGLCAATFYVIEEDGRKTPHAHGGSFGFVIDPTLLETAALFEDIKNHVAEWIRRVSHVAIPDNAALCREVERATRMKSDRTFGVSAVPLPEDVEGLERLGHTVAASLNHHRHVATCDRAKTVRCRLCMPEYHGQDTTDLCVVSLVPLNYNRHQSCPHDRIVDEVAFASAEETVDIAAIPLKDSIEREAIIRSILEQYRVERNGCVDSATTLECACPEAVRVPLIWVQSRPFIDEVRHEEDGPALNIQTASLLEIANFLVDGPSRNDDMRYREAGMYLRDFLDTCTESESLELLEEIRKSVRCSNGYTAAFNASVSGLLRCNTCMKISFNTVSSDSQLAYTTEYVTKVPKIRSVLNSVARAVKRWRERESTADDNGTFNRLTINVHQSASQHVQATQGNTEMSDNMLAMAISGADSDYFSCQFVSVNQDRDLNFIQKLIADDKDKEPVTSEEAMTEEEIIIYFPSPSRVQENELNDFEMSLRDENTRAGNDHPQFVDGFELFERQSIGDDLVDGFEIDRDSDNELAQELFDVRQREHGVTPSRNGATEDEDVDYIVENVDDTDGDSEYSPSHDEEDVDDTDDDSEYSPSHNEEHEDDVDGGEPQAMQGNHDEDRIRLYRPNMSRVRSAVSDPMMRYACRGPELADIPAYVYFARYQNISGKQPRTRNAVFAYADGIGPGNSQMMRSQFAVISFSGKGRPVPSQKQMTKSPAQKLRFSKFVLAYFKPWSINDLPQFDRANEACADFLAHCESANASFVEQGMLELIRRLIRENTVPVQTKLQIQGLRARHSDVLPWRGKNASTSNDSAVTMGNTTDVVAARKQELLEILLETHEHLSELTPQQQKMLSARSEFKRAFDLYIDLDISNDESDNAMRHAAADYWHEALLDEIDQQRCQMVRDRFMLNDASDADTNVDFGIERTLPRFTDQEIDRILLGCSASQRSFLQSFMPYIQALNRAQNDGGVIQTVDYNRTGRHGERKLVVRGAHGEESAPVSFDVWRLNTLLLGSPGTGKTHTIAKLIVAFEEYSGKKACVAAPTGAAAALYVGRGNTVHTSFGRKTATSNTQTRQDLLKSLGCDPQTELGLVIVDEVSMLASDSIHLMDASLRGAQESGPRRELPFGGIPIIFVGDFFQLRPVTASSIPSLRLRHGSNPKDNANVVEGSELICKCVQRTLSEQMRAAGDPGHAMRLKYARAELSKEDIRDGILCGYFEPIVQRDARDLSAASDRLHTRQRTHPMHPLIARLRPLDKGDAEWSLTNDDITVVCLDNVERLDINHGRAVGRVQRRGNILVRWRVQMKLTDELQDVDPEKLQLLRNQEDQFGQHMWQTFCRGEVCQILKNMNVRKRVCNGSKGRFYGLVWHDPEQHRQCHELIRIATLRGRRTIELPLPPDEILVEFEREQLGTDVQSQWPHDETVVPGKVVLPFEASSSASYGGKPVPVTVPLYSVLGRRLNSGSHSTNATMFHVDLALALTQWKVQGSTVGKMILWLAPRARSPQYTADGLYVLFSRCTSSDDMRYMQHTEELSALDHLIRLQFPSELHEWLSCFKPDPDDPHVKYYDFKEEDRIIQNRHQSILQNSKRKRR